jgi:hypothetical protein
MAQKFGYLTAHEAMARTRETEPDPAVKANPVTKDEKAAERAVEEAEMIWRTAANKVFEIVYPRRSPIRAIMSMAVNMLPDKGSTIREAGPSLAESKAREAMAEAGLAVEKARIKLTNIRKERGYRIAVWNEAHAGTAEPVVTPAAYSLNYDAPEFQPTLGS